MDQKEKIALIRKGNELFNKGDINAALKIFIQTDYRDGLVRIGDYYYYDKKQPLMAFKFYKKANMQQKVNEIFERMIYALGRWIKEDKKEAAGQKKDKTAETKKDDADEVPVKIAPALKKAAEDILKNTVQ